MKEISQEHIILFRIVYCTVFLFVVLGYIFAQQIVEVIIDMVAEVLHQVHLAGHHVSEGNHLLDNWVDTFINQDQPMVQGANLLLQLRCF